MLQSEQLQMREEKGAGEGGGGGDHGPGTISFVREWQEPDLLLAVGVAEFSQADIAEGVEDVQEVELEQLTQAAKHPT